MYHHTQYLPKKSLCAIIYTLIPAVQQVQRTLDSNIECTITGSSLFYVDESNCFNKIKNALGQFLNTQSHDDVLKNNTRLIKKIKKYKKLHPKQKIFNTLQKNLKKLHTEICIYNVKKIR